MFPRKCHGSVLAVLLSFTVVHSLCADEAVYRNGCRAAGKLQLDADGRLRFTPQDGKSKLSFADIQDVRFPEVVPHSSLWGAPLRIGFDKEEWITGELLGLTDKTVTVRTSWSESAALPRSTLASIMQLTGWITLVYEDFEADAIRLKLAQSPTFDEREHTSGRRSLRLDAVGQSATYSLSKPMDEGRFSVNFRESGESRNGRWFVEAEFGENQTVRVQLVGDADCSVQTAIPSKESRRLPRTPGWHRLEIRFRDDHLLIGVDGKLLFESAGDWKSKGLQSIGLSCVATPGAEAIHGAVCFDDFSIARPVAELRHEAGDPAQDECWLAGGDQLFGQVTRANSHTVGIQGRFGTRTIPWSSLRGFFLKSEATAPKTSDGAHARVWLDSGFPHADELEGVLLALDDRKLVLRHTVLGDITLDRSRLRKLRPIFFGKRIELDNARHHLGEEGRLVPGLYPPRAEGPRLRRTLRLESAPASARLLLTVQFARREADGIGGGLKRSERETEVLVNGRSIGTLNRYVDRAATDPQRIVIPIPADSLEARENIIELVQKPELKTGLRGNCVVSNLAVELPR
jgi:hypothetical protein